MIGNGISTPIFSLMFLTHARCEWTLSMERPTSWTFRFASSSAIPANAMNSVVQTGVKSAGWEKRMTHFPRRSESFRGPWVVSASNSGAFSPSTGI